MGSTCTCTSGTFWAPSTISCARRCSTPKRLYTITSTCTMGPPDCSLAAAGYTGGCPTSTERCGRVRGRPVEAPFENLDQSKVRDDEQQQHTEEQRRQGCEADYLTYWCDHN